MKIGKVNCLERIGMSFPSIYLWASISLGWKSSKNVKGEELLAMVVSNRWMVSSNPIHARFRMSVSVTLLYLFDHAWVMMNPA